MSFFNSLQLGLGSRTYSPSTLPRFGAHHPSVTQGKALDDAKACTPERAVALFQQAKDAYWEADARANYSAPSGTSVDSKKVYAAVKGQTDPLVLIAEHAPLETVEALNLAVEESTWTAPEALSLAIVKRLEAKV